jgi:hypothetical protein
VGGWVGGVGVESRHTGRSVCPAIGQTEKMVRYLRKTEKTARPFILTGLNRTGACRADRLGRGDGPGPGAGLGAWMAPEADSGRRVFSSRTVASNIALRRMYPYCPESGPGPQADSDRGNRARRDPVRPGRPQGPGPHAEGSETAGKTPRRALCRGNCRLGIGWFGHGRAQRPAPPPPQARFAGDLSPGPHAGPPPLPPPSQTRGEDAALRGTGPRERSGSRIPRPRGLVRRAVPACYAPSSSLARRTL